MAKSRVQSKCPKCDHTFIPSIKEVQSRAGSSSRSKGAGFERNTAKKFAKWWPGDYEFKRTPMSGGSVLKVGWDLAGDICTNAPDFKIHLELKNAPGSFAGLHQFYTAPSGALWKWLKQSEDECPDGKIPMLIFNRFDMPTYCAVNAWWDLSIVRRLVISNINYYEFHDVNKKVHVIIWHLSDMLASDPENWKWA